MAEFDFTEADLFGTPEDEGISVTPEVEFSEAELFGTAPEAVTTPTAAPTVDFSEQDLFGDTQQVEQDYQDIRTLGDRPEADVTDGGAGFWPSVKSGFAGVYQSAVMTPSKLLNAEMQEFAQENFPDSDFAAWTQDEGARLEQVDTSVGDFRSRQPVSKTIQTMAESESIGEFFDSFMESEEKWTVVKEVIGSSAPFSLGMMAGTAYAGLPGTFSSVFMMDWGDSYQESLKAGKSPEDAKWDATVKSLTQAGFDTATMGAARIQLSANKFADWTGQMAIQMVGGGGAEAAKHELVNEKYTVGEVALEASGELAGGPFEILTARMTQKADKERKTKIETLNELIGKMKEAEERSDVETAQVHVRDIINQLEGVELQEAVEGESLPKVGIDAEELQNVGSGQTITDETGMNILTNATVETAEGIQRLAEHDWTASSVAVAEETHWKKPIQEARVQIAKLKDVEAFQMQALAQGNEEGNADLLTSIQQEIATVEGDVAVFEQKQLQEQEAVRNAGKVMEEWIQTYAPGMKVVVSSGQVGSVAAEAVMEVVEQKQALGMYKSEKEYQAARAQAKAFSIKSEEAENVNGQYYELADGVAVIEADALASRTFDDTINQAEFMETVAHEFGHALISHVYKGTDTSTKAALINGYRKWLKRLASAKDQKQFQGIRSGVLKEARTTAGAFGIKPGIKTYVYGMNEYLANQMMKAAGSDKLAGTPVAKFFKEALAKLRSFFNENKAHLPEQSFQNFLNMLAAKTTLSELEKAQASTDVENQSVVAEKAFATVKSILDSSMLAPRGPTGKAAKVKGKYGGEEFRGDLDTYNSVLKWGTTLIQMGKLNPHIPGLQKYVGLIKEWWNTKMQQTAKADERLKQWNDLKAKDSENLGAFMQELTVKSYDDAQRYGKDSDVWKKLVEKYKMSDEMLAMADLIENDFAEVLQELEAVQVDDANRTFTDEVDRATAIKAIEGNFRALRERNFFPLSRFGDQYMRVKAERDMTYDGVEYRAGETITFETFESEGDMLKRQRVFKNSSKYLIEGGLMNDTQKQFAGFPPQFLSMLKNKLDLNEVQQGEFEDLIHDLAPGKSFTKHMMHRKNTPGYSTDGVRSYANYFLHFGNYVARIKYKGVLQEAINEVGDSASIIGKRTGNGTKRTKIQQFMSDHYEAAMNPGNELANLRAIGFLWYLGFVPKSAMVNLTQVPLVTYPFLAARHGDVKALAALGKATKDAGKYWLNPRAMSEGQMSMIQELINSGILDESMATELAAAAEGSLLQRVAPGNILGSQKAARGVRRMAGAGAWMFQKAEKMNRRVTALAAYGLARESGADHVAGVEAARDAVESTQYEYARWNRPRFSQGKKSVMFLFWQYMQNSLFFLAHDPGRLRYAAMMLLFAGLSGFPFAEDAMDLYNYIAKKLNKQYGEDFAPANMQLAAREFIHELGMNPDMVMHGASRYSFGMSALGDMVGLPIPNVDMSGSLSMGSIIPGWHAMLGDGNFDKGLGRGAEDLGGAVVAMPIQLMRAIADDNPDTLKRFERAMPSFAKHMSKAYRRATRGEETLPDGTVIANFNLDDSMHKAEIAMQFLGFQTTRVADAQEPHYMTKEILQYYALRRQSLTQLLDHAKKSGDSTMWGKTWNEVRKYNKSLQKKGLGSMGIRPSSVRRSLKDRAKQRIMQEKGFVGGKMGRQVSQEVYDSFPTEEEVP